MSPADRMVAARDHAEANLKAAVYTPSCTMKRFPLRLGALLMRAVLRLDRRGAPKLCVEDINIALNQRELWVLHLAVAFITSWRARGIELRVLGKGALGTLLGWSIRCRTRGIGPVTLAPLTTLVSVSGIRLVADERTSLSASARKDRACVSSYTARNANCRSEAGWVRHIAQISSVVASYPICLKTLRVSAIVNSESEMVISDP